MRTDFLTERDKARLRLEYMNAALQRAKKLPKIEELTSDRKPPSLKEISARLRSLPTYEKQGHTKAK